MLKLFNTLTGRQEVFEPMEPKHVRMYVCGVTVYDYCHIGHARSALVFDVLRRYLEYCGYGVTFVKNFTDVDDKIIKRANEQGVNCETITQKFIQAYHDDMAKLGVRPASIEPKATEHMAEIIELTRTLLQKKLAYQVEGDVYFDVAKYPKYGTLSKRKLEDLQAGARVEIDERKQHPMDFALWKKSKAGEPAWDSPWGPGRPGWHIECSAMSIRHLGETFDIHGGGMDLIFPHHENEIAQSCGATGSDSPSIGSITGLSKSIKRRCRSHSATSLPSARSSKNLTGPRKSRVRSSRYFLLSTHYHGPLDFSDHALKEAKSALNGFYDLFGRLAESEDKAIADAELDLAIDRCQAGFRAAMDDDLNTPAAIAAFQGLRSDVNKLVGAGLSSEGRKRARQAFRAVGGVIGIFQLERWDFNVRVEPKSADLAVTAFSPTVAMAKQITPDEIDAKVAERIEAKKRKDFKRADEIRAELKSFGITVEDKPDGTSRWKR